MKPEHRRRGISFQTIQLNAEQGLQYIPRYPDRHLDAQEMIDRMIEIVPVGTGLFRNVVPKVIEDRLKEHQTVAWSNSI